MKQVLSEVSRQYYGLIQILPYMQKKYKPHITNKKYSASNDENNQLFTVFL